MDSVDENNIDFDQSNSSKSFSKIKSTVSLSCMSDLMAKSSNNKSMFKEDIANLKSNNNHNSFQRSISLPIEKSSNSNNSSPLRNPLKNKINEYNTQQQALSALYNSTNGINWRTSKNWVIIPIDNTSKMTTINHKEIPKVKSKHINFSKSIEYFMKLSPSNEKQQYNEKPLTKIIFHDWHGIEVDDQQNIIEIRLLMNELNGHIPMTFCNLPQLCYLDLSNNQIKGCIPSNIDRLVNLRELKLHYNQISGEIPSSIGNCMHLRGIHLEGNQLTVHLIEGFII